MLAIRMRDLHELKWNQFNYSHKNNAPVVQIAQWVVQIAQTLSVLKGGQNERMGTSRHSGSTPLCQES